MVGKTQKQEPEFHSQEADSEGCCCQLRLSTSTGQDPVTGDSLPTSSLHHHSRAYPPQACPESVYHGTLDSVKLRINSGHHSCPPS